jgi:hypothetical protein
VPIWAVCCLAEVLPPVCKRLGAAPAWRVTSQREQDEPFLGRALCWQEWRVSGVCAQRDWTVGCSLGCFLSGWSLVVDCFDHLQYQPGGSRPSDSRGWGLPGGKGLCDGNN